MSHYTSLADPHHFIQIAMGWDNECLHSFHIYGQDYGIAYAGGMSFSHNARQTFPEDFGFDVDDRFTYTYNFQDFWNCDIRLEAIEPMTRISPWCASGSGRQGDGMRYYKIDVALALLEFARPERIRRYRLTRITCSAVCERYRWARRTGSFEVLGE